MKRARKLLKAYSDLHNSPTAMISRISYVIVYIIALTTVGSSLFALLFRQMNEINNGNNLSGFSMMMVLLIIRNVYMGFFEDKRASTKNNLRALTMHLPISKKDFVLAQYIGSIYLFLPAFFVMVCLIIFSMIAEKSLLYQFELGTVLIAFGITYSATSLEKGMLTYYYLDPRIRELVYSVGTIFWMILNYIIEVEETGQLASIINIGQEPLWFQGICHLGGLYGLPMIGLILFIGYWCQMRLPLILERRK